VTRQKYVHGCKCEAEKFVSAPGPQKVVARGRYSLLFAVAIAHAKYHEHTPLNQQASQMKRQGLAVKTNVLWEQTVHLRKHVRPTYDAIHIAALNEPVLGADETGYPMLEKGRELWQVLCLVSPNLSYLRIGRHKDTAAIVDLLSFPDTDTQTNLLSLPKTKKKGKPYAGGLMTDGAAVYGAAQKETSGTFYWSNCWSHARRYFLEAEPDYPKATKALDLIDKLFEIERDAVDLADELAQQAGVEIAKGSKTVPASVEQCAASIPVANPFLLEARARLRKSRSRPVLAKLKKWMRRSATSWDGSALNKAIRYVDDRWKHLRIFLSHPAVPIHNNASEFALRRPVMGRRRFCGIKSKLGADVAAIFYTLLETARKHGLDPLAYLYTVAVRAIENPGTVTLPWHITCGEVELLKPSD
jgi:transposase